VTPAPRKVHLHSPPGLGALPQAEEITPFLVPRLPPARNLADGGHHPGGSSKATTALPCPNPLGAGHGRGTNHSTDRGDGPTTTGRSRSDRQIEVPCGHRGKHRGNGTLSNVAGKPEALPRRLPFRLGVPAVWPRTPFPSSAVVRRDRRGGGRHRPPRSVLRPLSCS